MRRLAAAILLIVAAHSRALAQGLPPYQALNPILTGRSGMLFTPFVDAGRKWETRVQLDYGNLIEFSQRENAELVLDGEIMRLDATVLRNIGRGFVGGSVAMQGAYDGFLDGFLDWYHKLTGLQVAARGLRPRNEFLYSAAMPNGDSVGYQARSAFLGDFRLMGGLRHGRNWQTTLSVTLPTGTLGYGRKTVSVSAYSTARFRLDHRWTTEMGLGLGYTPKAGVLQDYQKTVFAAGNLGFRYRFVKQQAMFVNLWVQSHNYDGTGLRAFDQREVTLDYGFLLKARRGPEWFLGMTEDLEPRGPAIDLSLRIGAKW